MYKPSLVMATQMLLSENLQYIGAVIAACMMGGWWWYHQSFLALYLLRELEMLDLWCRMLPHLQSLFKLYSENIYSGLFRVNINLYLYEFNKNSLILSRRQMNIFRQLWLHLIYLSFFYFLPFSLKVSIFYWTSSGMIKTKNAAISITIEE